MSYFNVAFETVIMKIEKAWSDHPADTGGKTAWGLSSKWHPELFKDGKVPTLEDARLIYRKLYWNVLYDELVYSRQAVELFEAGVLCGVHNAVEFTQSAVNLLRNPDEHDLINIDGDFGPITLGRCNDYGQIETHANALYRASNYFQARYLIQKKQPEFIRGWFAKRLD